MERLQLSTGNVAAAAQRASEVLQNGGVILYPTDTLYGLGADAFSNVAVDKVIAIKGRDGKKPIHCIVSDMEMAAKYAEISNDALLLAKEFFPGPLTIILPKRSGVGTGIARDIETVGIRVPKNDFCTMLAREIGKPFTGTSANAAGEKPQQSVEKILLQLAPAPDAVDLIVDAGELSVSLPSTVVDLAHEEPIILREGAIEAAEVWNVLRPSI